MAILVSTGGNGEIDWDDLLVEIQEELAERDQIDLNDQYAQDPRSIDVE